MRLQLLVSAPAEYVLVLVLHHIAGDGWSMGCWGGTWPGVRGAVCGAGAGAGQPLPVQYADYTLWQRELLGTSTTRAALAAQQLGVLDRQRWRGCRRSWRCRLTGRGRRWPAYRGGSVGLPTLPPAAARGAGGAGPRHGVTLFMVVQAAVAALLTRLGAGTDIPLGTPVAGRTDEALDDLVGFFVNTLVLRTDTAGNPAFRELLGRVRADRPGRARAPGAAVRAAGGGAQPGPLAGPPPAVPGHGRAARGTPTAALDAARADLHASSRSNRRDRQVRPVVDLAEVRRAPTARPAG